MLKVYCTHCRAHLYWYGGRFTGQVRRQSFKPARPDVPKPKPTDSMRCVRCGEPWYMVKAPTGGIVLLTNEGIKPKAPSGTRPAPEHIVIPEPPPDLQGTGSEFKDPREQRRR